MVVKVWYYIKKALKHCGISCIWREGRGGREGRGRDVREYDEFGGLGIKIGNITFFIPSGQ